MIKLPRILDISDSDRFNSQEKDLWTSVLISYFEDASRSALTPIEVTLLLKDAQDEWTKSICDLIGFDHDFFYEHLEKEIKNNKPKRDAFFKTQTEFYRLLKENP